MQSQDISCFQPMTQIIIEQTSASSDHAEIKRPEIYNDYLQISTNIPQDLDNLDISTTQSSIVEAEMNLNQASSDEIHAFSNNPDVVVIKISEAGVSQKSSGEDHLEAERCCRFCFETEDTSEKGKLISPCRCGGTVRHIHEVCLKTWIAHKEANDAVGPKCEICSAFYRVEARVRLKFNPSRACDEGFPHLLHGIGLAICTVNLLWFASKCMGLEFTKGEENSESSERIKIVDQVSIVVCSFLGFTFFVAMVISFKSAFFENRRKVTKIYNFDLTYQQQAQELEDAVSYDIKNGDHFDDYEDEDDVNTQENDEKDQRLECPLYENNSQGIQPLDETLCNLVEVEMSITAYQLQPV